MKACFKKESLFGSFYGFWIILKNYIDQFSKHGLKNRRSTNLVHCEVYFDKTPKKMSWSSSEEDGGTREKNINYSHAERWRMLEVPIGFVNRKYKKIKDENDPRYGKKFSTERELYLFLNEIDRNYDWNLIMHYVIPLIPDSKKDFVCSESLMFALGYSFDKYTKITPMKAFDILVEDLKKYN